MTAPDGLLLWVGGEEGDLSEDFLLLGVRDGVLQVYNKRDKGEGEGYSILIKKKELRKIMKKSIFKGEENSLKIIWKENRR